MRRRSLLAALLVAALLLVAPLLLTAAHAAELVVRVTDGRGGPQAGAVVVLEPGAGAQPPAGAPRAVIDQVDRAFTPHVSVLRTGTSVSFPNHDNIRHSVYSYSKARSFTLRLYAGQPANPVVFDRPGVVALGCNIHDSMLAWVLVVDTPWTARSDGEGVARLAGLPAGRYRLRTWAEPMPALAEGIDVELAGDAAVHREVVLDPARYAAEPPAAP
jgi:plastocyanin